MLPPIVAPVAGTLALTVEEEIHWHAAIPAAEPEILTAGDEEAEEVPLISNPNIVIEVAPVAGPLATRIEETTPPSCVNVRVRVIVELASFADTTTEARRATPAGTFARIDEWLSQDEPASPIAVAPSRADKERTISLPIVGLVAVGPPKLRPWIVRLVAPVVGAFTFTKELTKPTSTVNAHDKVPNAMLGLSDVVSTTAIVARSRPSTCPRPRRPLPDPATGDLQTREESDFH